MPDTRKSENAITGTSSVDSVLTKGASLAWTSAAPALLRWRSLIATGAYREAEAFLSSERAQQTSPDRAIEEAAALMPRLRYEWSLDRAAMLAKLRAELPDVSEADLDAWTIGGQIESILLDGERRYFRREPRNLFLFDRAARERRAKATGKPLPPDRHDSTSPIIPTLVGIIASSERSLNDHERSPAKREVMPIRTRCEYTLLVKPDRPGATKGSIVRAWLPFPQVYGQQKDVTLIDSFPRTERISPKDSPQRTIYFQQKIRDVSKPVRFEVSFECTTAAFLWHGLPAHQSRAGSPCHDDLTERPPHIVFTDEVRAIVREQSHDGPDKTTLAKRLWEWVESNIPWRAEHEYCLIPSIAEQALRLRKGDCGTAALVYLSLCRCAGIPARWQSGFTTDPVGANLHDWTEIWLDDHGWIPVDPSYGKKSHPDPRVRDFYFGNLDPYRLIVNTDYGQPLSPPMNGLRAEPLDFQRGEVELDGRVLYFDEWEYGFTFTHSQLPA